MSVREIEKIEKLEEELAKLGNAFWTLVNILSKNGVIGVAQYMMVTEAHDEG